MDARDWDRSKNRTRTAMFYKQQKYNLMREESEGYAKLVTELNTNHTVARSSAPTLVRNIQALIGHFALDPNRVLSEIVGAFESSNPAKESHSRAVFVQVLKDYKTGPAALSNLLGLRFSSYPKAVADAKAAAAEWTAEADAAAAAGETFATKKPVVDPRLTETPDSLYNVAAVLIQEGLLTLEQIFPHLTPTIATQKESHKTAEAAAKTKVVKKLEVDQLTEAKNAKHTAAIKLGKSNQVLGLCHAALLIHDWPTANRIMAQLPPFAAPAWPAFRKRLCTVAHAVVEPLYRKVAPAITKPSTDLSDWIKSISVCKDFEDMPVLLFPVLRRLGMYGHSDVILLTKVLRVVKACFAESKKRGDANLAMQPEVEALFNRVIMPSISLIETGNAALSIEAWQVLEMMPYVARYRLYSFWKNTSAKLHPDVMLAQKMATKETVYIMKRLTKDNVKLYGRILGKFSHSNPGSVFGHILYVIQEDGYNNLVAPVVESMKYLGPLAKDMLAFCIIEAIANTKKPRLKAGDINIGEWLRTLSNFSALVFRKYTIDMEGVLQYVMNKLKTREGFDLIVFQDFIKQMTGMERVEDVPDEHLLALAGGSTLAEEGSFGGSKVTKEQTKATGRLRKVLLAHDSNGEDFALPLLLLIAQQLSSMVFGSKMEDQNLKLVGDLYDKCTETLTQFTAFLTRHVKPDDYVSRIPAVKELCETFKLPPRVAFHLRRPAWNVLVKAELKKLGEKEDSLTGYVAACREAMAPIEAECANIVSPDLWKYVTPKFFATFWTFSMYDLDTPSHVYKKTTAKVKAEMAVFEKASPPPSRTKLKKERARVETLLEALKSEEAQQKLNRRQVAATLDVGKDSSSCRSRFLDALLLPPPSSSPSTVRRFFSSRPSLSRRLLALSLSFPLPLLFWLPRRCKLLNSFFSDPAPLLRSLSPPRSRSRSLSPPRSRSRSLSPRRSRSRSRSDDVRSFEDESLPRSFSDLLLLRPPPFPDSLRSLDDAGESAATISASPSPSTRSAFLLPFLLSFFLPSFFLPPPPPLPSLLSSF